MRNAGSAGFAIGLHLTFASPRYLLQAYPAAWQDIYSRNGYLMRDPTVHWGLANSGWIGWSDLRQHDPDGILDQAAEYGLHHGLTVSVLERGSRSIASFAREDREFTSGEAASICAHVTELHDISFSIHALPAPLHNLLRRLSIILTQG